MVIPVTEPEIIEKPPGPAKDPVLPTTCESEDPAEPVQNSRDKNLKITKSTTSPSGNPSPETEDS
jgi:hypothetical protein